MCKPERSNAILARLVAAGIAAATVYAFLAWLFTQTPFLAVYLIVAVALGVAGCGFVAWNLRYGSWVMQRPFRQPRRALPAAPPCKALTANQVLTRPELAARPRQVVAGVVVERSEKVSG